MNTTRTSRVNGPPRTRKLTSYWKSAQPNLSDKGLPPEVVLQIFTFLDRVDIDNCRLVNHRWLNIIDKNTHLLRQRFIRMLKVVDNGNNMITISASSRTKCIKYNLNMEINNHIDADMIKRLANLLKGSLIKRTVICNLTLTELWVYDLYTIFNRANVKFARFEMIGVAIDQLTRDSFQNFIGEKVAAKVYFLDGIRNGDADFFNSRLLEKTNIVNAEDFTVYDVSSLAGEEVILDLGDEALLDFFFGRNITSKRRTTLYLDSPAVSQSFVYSALVRFVHETNYESMMQHAEFTHIREQIIHSHRAITNEYDTDIQSEWSSKNAKTDLVLEVKVTRASEDDELVHVTMDICNGRTMC
uniref:F-box domain-containing protein n=1 Tax=Panagrellus redivivus TaxID=6233 RepID=A0A7E4ZQU2_PANRE